MNLILTKSNKKTPLSKSQSTFNRLVTKIEKLQTAIQKTEMILSEGLSYYHSKVRPIEKEMVEKLLLCIPIFYSYYKHPKSFSTRQHEILKELILSLLDRLLTHIPHQQISPEIIVIIEDLEGINFQEACDSELQIIKKDLKNFTASQGLDLDLSNINFSASIDEIKAQFQEAMLEALKNKKTEQPGAKNTQEKVKKKTAQQLKKEQKAKELEELRKKGFAKIYRELVKVLHPDLELDLSVKAEKETLMKKLTTAYENQDLHTLLLLQITWMNQIASNEGESRYQQPEEQLKIYNSILKDQVEALQDELHYLPADPRYRDMLHILHDDYNTSIFEILQDEKEQLSADVKRYSAAIMDLGGTSNFKRVKEILKEFSTPNEDDIILSHLMKMFS